MLTTPLRPIASSTMRCSLKMLALFRGFSASAQPLQPQNQQPMASYPSHDVAAPPLLGFGTWRLKDSFDNTSAAVSHAIQTGYRHIDCAAIYGNEEAVGQGIADGLKKAGVDRGDIWVTSKLWNDRHDPAKVADGLDKTLKDLKLDYVDEYLMHWPVGNTGEEGKLVEDYVEAWQAMENLLQNGKTRYIGVSNFSPAQLTKLIKQSAVMPAVHQMELHPYLQQSKWIDWHRQQGIHVTAYSPLGNMNPVYGERNVEAQSDPPVLLEDKVLGAIAEERGCTIPQVALAWGMSRGTSVIPKSKHPRWIEENFGSIKCELQWQDYAKIRELGEKYVKRYNNPSGGWGVELFDGLDDA